MVPNRGRFDSHESNLPLKLFHKKRKRWLTTTIFHSVPCYNGTMITKDYYNDFLKSGNKKLTSVSSNGVYLTTIQSIP